MRTLVRRRANIRILAAIEEGKKTQSILFTILQIVGGLLIILLGFF